MSTRRTTARRLAPVAGLSAALLLSACGAGQKAQTYQERTVADATNSAVGTIAVRNLAVLGPAQGIVLKQGTDAPMTVTMVNDGGEDDVLLRATTPDAASVVVLGPSPEVRLPRLATADPRYRLVLNDLTRDLRVGEFVQLTLDFQRNGSKTVLVPVQTTPDGSPRSGNDYEVPETDSEGKPLQKGDNVTEGSSGDVKGDEGTGTPASE